MIFTRISQFLGLRVKARLKDPENKNLLRKRLFAQGALALSLTLISAGLLVSWSQSLHDHYEEVEVIVANRDLISGENLKRSDLKIISLRKNTLPKTTIQSSMLESISGQTLIHNMSENQVFTRNEFLPEIPPGIVGLGIEADKKGMSLSTSWLSGAYPSLKPGDTLTFLVSQTFPGKTTDVQILSQHVQVIDVTAGTEKEPGSLLIKVDEDLASKLLMIHSTPGTNIQPLVDGYKPISTVESTVNLSVTK